MAKLYKRPNSPNWYGSYRINGKRIRFATDFTDSGAAQKQADQAEKAALEALKSEAGLRFGEAASLFFSAKQLAPATVSQYERSMGYILQTLGDFSLQGLGKAGVQRYISDRLGECGTVTLRRELAFLSSLYEFVINTQVTDIEANPVKLVKKSHIPDAKKRTRYTSKREYQKLIENCNTTLHRTILILGVNTGMRAQEMLQLHVDEVDFENHLITLPEWRTKTDQRREIPLAPAALEALQELKREWLLYYATKPWTHKGSHMKCPAEKEWTGHFFENAITGKPIASVKSWWSGLTRKCGVKDLRLHDLRHTFCTWGLQSGADQISLMAITGHRSVASFHRYSHATDEGRQRAINLLSGHTSVTRANDKRDTGGNHM